MRRPRSRPAALAECVRPDDAGPSAWTRRRSLLTSCFMRDPSRRGTTHLSCHAGAKPDGGRRRRGGAPAHGTTRSIRAIAEPALGKVVGQSLKAKFVVIDHA